MPQFPIIDDCKDAADVMARVKARRNGKTYPHKGFGFVRPTPPPKIVKPPPPPPPPVIVEPLRDNVVDPGRLINLLDFNRGCVCDVEMDLFVSLQLVINETVKWFDAYYKSQGLIGFTIDELICSRRYQRIGKARMVCAYVANKITTFSVSAIGRKMNKDHSSIIHMLAKMKCIMESQDAHTQYLRDAAEAIEKAVLGS